VTTVVDNDTITTPISIWGFFNVGGFFSSAETLIGIAVGRRADRLRHPAADAAHRDLTGCARKPRRQTGCAAPFLLGIQTRAVQNSGRFDVIISRSADVQDQD